MKRYWAEFPGPVSSNQIAPNFFALDEYASPCNMPYPNSVSLPEISSSSSRSSTPLQLLSTPSQASMASGLIESSESSQSRPRASTQLASPYPSRSESLAWTLQAPLVQPTSQWSPSGFWQSDAS